MKKIIGITACTAGVAHTYMAQAAIEKEGKKRGFEVKVETQGMMGIEDELSEEDIGNACLVIIGADISVEGLERFGNLPIYETKTSKCVSQIEHVYDEALKLI
jgi:fructose-specific phosphotransferase system IIB component